jgi:hypothetical protein
LTYIHAISVVIFPDGLFKYVAHIAKHITGINVPASARAEGLPATQG